MKKRKRLSFFMVLNMLFSLIFTMPVRAEYNINPIVEDGTGEIASAADLKIGDYVQMGSYYDEPILWRCVDIDEKGPLILSDKILCLKTYDAPGDNESGSHGRFVSRKEVGANYWKDSNIRLWLNSDAGAGDMVWSCGNPPSAENVEYNAYADEAGFLNKFTALEKGVMKSVVQKSLLTAADKDIAGAKGSAFHKYNEKIYSVSDGKLVYESILENYDEAYYEEVEDKVFLLDVKQIQNVFNHTPQLGLWYHIGKLTKKAVENNEAKSSLIKEGEDWYNWLRTPYVNDEGNQGSVRHVSRNGQIGCSITKADDIGVRPAFYMKEDTVFLRGNGSADTPYLLTHAHTLTHYDAKAATCTEPGTGEYWKCEGTGSCGKMFSDENGTVEITDVPAGEAVKGHRYSKWEITTIPTLKAKGEAVRVCQNDKSHKEIKELSNLTDTKVWTAGERKEPTETESGSQQYKSEYGIVTVVIPALGHIHKLIHHNVQAATCTEPGTGEYWKCEGTGSCGKMFGDGNGTVEIADVPAGEDAIGHRYGKWEITNPPTLEANGKAVRVCQNEESHKEIKELPNLTDTDVWTAGERKEPTDTESGSQQYTSKYGIVTVIIPALSHMHKLIHYDGVAATCTEPGTGEYWKCEGTGSCGKMFRDENGMVEITDVPTEEAKGHRYGEWEITTVPTLESIGKAVRVCQNEESHKEIKELSRLTDTHVWTAGDRKEPTETENGSQQYISEYGIVTVIIPATGRKPTLPPQNDEKKPNKKEDKTDKKQDKSEKEQQGLALNAKLKVSQVGRKINIHWGKVSHADGYHVYVQYCGMKFSDKSLNQVKGADNTSITVKRVNGKNLDLKKNYKIYVEAYELSDGKKKILGKSITAHIVGKNNKKYTNVKGVRVNKNSYTLKRGSTITIQAKVVLVSRGKKQLSDAHARQFRYASSDKKIATVSKNGKIEATGKGTCIVYVYARNGFAKEIKISVK